MDSMTNMMSQFIGTMMYGFPPVTPTYPGPSTPNVPPPSAPLPMTYSMYPYMGPSTTPATSSAPPPPAPTQGSDDDED